VDSGRVLLSAQDDALQNITGTMLDISAGPNNVSGAFSVNALCQTWVNATGGEYNKQTIRLMPPVWRTSAETRPRNIAFNYIVRAA
jgi:hypothetical protein